MVSENEMLTKAALRKRHSDIRNNISLEDRVRWSKEACGHAATYIDQNAVKSVMAYVSFRSELDLRPLIEWCWDRNVAVIIPRSNPSTYQMSLHRLQSWDELKKGAYGILEPGSSSPEWNAEERLEMIIVPGLAFDLHGGRLGYGGGFYDRFAAENVCNAKWIGACFEAQLTNKIEQESHDLVLEGLITEEACYRFN